MTLHVDMPTGYVHERYFGRAYWHIADIGHFASLLRMNTPDECRERAEECRQQAETAVNPRDKEVWLHIAESWMKLAQEAEPRQPKRKQ